MCLNEASDSPFRYLDPYSRPLHIVLGGLRPAKGCTFPPIWIAHRSSGSHLCRYAAQSLNQDSRFAAEICIKETLFPEASTRSQGVSLNLSGRHSTLALPLYLICLFSVLQYGTLIVTTILDTFPSYLIRLQDTEILLTMPMLTITCTLQNFTWSFVMLCCVMTSVFYFQQ